MTMTNQSIGNFGYLDKKKFATNICSHFFNAFLAYSIVLLIIATIGIAEPLQNLLYGNLFSIFASLLIFFIIGWGIPQLINSTDLDDTAKYIGFGFIIVLKAIYIAPLIVPLASQYPDLLRNTFIGVIGIAGIVYNIADTGVKEGRDFDSLTTTFILGLRFLIFFGLASIIFGLSPSLLYVFIAIFVYSVGLLIMISEVMRADAELLIFSKGDELNASLTIFSLLENLLIAVILLFLLLAAASHKH